MHFKINRMHRERKVIEVHEHTFPPKLLDGLTG